MALRDAVEKVNGSLEKYLMIITGSALVFSTLLTFAGVILRYLFGISYEWNEELCRYSMIVIVYLWAGSMVRKNQHISFTLFSDHLKATGRFLHRLAINVLVLFFGVPIAWWGFQLAKAAWEAELKTLSLLFPLWPAYAIVPVGVVLIVIQAFLDTVWMGIERFMRTREAD